MFHQHTCLSPYAHLLAYIVLVCQPTSLFPANLHHILHPTWKCDEYIAVPPSAEVVLMRYFMTKKAIQKAP